MPRMKKPCACLLALSFILALCAPAITALAQQSTGGSDTGDTPVEARPYFSEPSISPDRSEIAFVSGGDIWTVPASGGEARLLVSHPSTEFRPVYSPDGRRVAFTSARTGNGDVYVLTLDTGDLRRLTFDDGFDQLDAWSRDGRWIYFSTTARDIAGMNDVHRVSAEGGTPMQLSADRYVNEYFSAPSPDGATLAITARGIVSSQWWRKGSSHIDQSEIWLMRAGDGAGGAKPTYESVTSGGARDAWPMWGADARTMFYVSDRGGAQNVWSKPMGSAAGEARQVTKFTGGRVLWPTISYDAKTIVFERDFKIWKLDTATSQASEVSITRRGVASAPSVERQRLAPPEQIQELALAPDGKKVAFVWRGEVFAASASDGGDAARVTTSPASEMQIAWAPDSRRLVYVSDRDGAAHLFLYDFATNAETKLTNSAQSDFTPRFSPDGKMIAYERNGRELRVLNVATKQDRAVASGNLERPPLNSDRPFVWSPDSRWIALMSDGDKLFRNVQIVAVEGGIGGVVQPASFLANLGSNTVSWSPDGTYLLFDTGVRTETNQLARIDLIPRTPRFREDQFRELFREETPRTVAPSLRREENRPSPSPDPTTTTTTTTPTPDPSATPTPSASPTPSPTPSASPAPASSPTSGEDPKKPKPVEVVFDGIRRRLSMLPVGVDVNLQIISPDGKFVAMIASAENQQNLYVFPLDELSRDPAVARQLTSTAGGKSYAQFTSDSKEIFYLENGRIQIVPLDARQTARSLNVAAEMDIDFAREKRAVFNQAWAYMRDHFYDDKYHGADWQALRGVYESQVAGARTPDEVRRVMQLMVGELNASHLGVSAPPGMVQIVTGRLGLRFDRVEYERTGRLRVAEVIPLSPAAVARETASGSERIREIKVGEYLLSVDGRALDARTNLEELLNYKINRRVVLTVASSPDGADKREVAVRPVNLATEKVLLYRKWVDERRAYVARVSGGKLGYVHMADMSANSLSQLYLDLDAENHAREGVVIDIRNNNGGFVNVYAIDVFARRGYLTMTPRGFVATPARLMLGQRSLQTPTVLVTNQHSLSDAEDFSEGYRALGLGKIVGEPTSGWIIYTSNVSLIDGSVFRLPFIKVQASDGQVMELNPRPVDIPVKRPVGESYTESDSQLDAAVRELLRAKGERARQE